RGIISTTCRLFPSSRTSIMRCTWASLLLLASLTVARADGPKDNIPDNVRKIPPPRVKVPDADRQELDTGLAELQALIAHVTSTEQGQAESLALLPDVQVYHKAVHDALTYDEFFNVKEIAVAKNHLKTGLQRARALAEGKHPWTAQTGLVVRAYRSKIDGS